MGPGRFAPWGRWEVTEDGRVMLSFRCACNPGEVHTQFVAPKNGHSVEMRCPLCQELIVNVRVSEEKG